MRTATLAQVNERLTRNYIRAKSLRDAMRSDEQSFLTRCRQEYHEGRMMGIIQSYAEFTDMTFDEAWAKLEQMS